MCGLPRLAKTFTTQNVLVNLSVFFPSIYLSIYLSAYLSACAKWHSPYTIQLRSYISRGCRSKVLCAGWVEHDLHSRARLVKTQGVLLEEDVGQALAFKWPIGEPLIWVSLSCVGEKQSLLARKLRAEIGSSRRAELRDAVLTNAENQLS